MAQWVMKWRGEAVSVLAGLSLGFIGIGIVAIAPNLSALATGVAIAASSAGFTWTPFNDAVHRAMPTHTRPTALSWISTGASLGVIMAAIAALVVSMSGLSWRICWALFAAAGGVVLVFNWRTLGWGDEASGHAGVTVPARAFLVPPALSLFAVAFVMGMTSAVFIAFAADHMTQSGGVAGLPQASTPAMVFLVYGVFGLAGLGTGAVRRAIGLAALVRAVMLAGAVSAASAALLAGTWSGLILSAGAQGIHVMMTSAVIAFWSERLFPAVPSVGFTVALVALAAGSVAGPALAGVVSDSFGAAPMFLGSATLVLAAGLALRRRHLSEQPAREARAPTASTAGG